MASFRSLPPELLLQIAGWIDDKYTLSAIARVNRTCSAVYMQPLFTRYGSEAVQWAARHGNREILEKATFFARDRKHALVNAEYRPDPFGGAGLDSDDEQMYNERYGTPLHIACAAGHIDIVTFLLDNGADMAYSSNRLCGCLYMDDSFGEYYGDDDIMDRPKWLPLHFALCHKHPEVAILLLERGAPLHVSASSASGGRYSVTALQSAAENGLVSVVRYLKEYFQREKGTMEASVSSDSTEGQELYDGPVDSMTQDDVATDSDSDPEDGEPFDSDMSDSEGLNDDDEMESDSDMETDSDESDASNDTTDTDELDFWGQSADPSDPRSADLYGNTAMHYVSLCFDFEAACAIVQDLKELGLNVDERGGRRDATPLLMACCMGNFSAARAFLRSGAYAEAVVEEDFADYDVLEGASSCLDNALYARYSDRAASHQAEEVWQQERYQLVKELIKAGVDVEFLPGTSGATPIGIAAQRGLEHETKLLLELGGAYVNGMAESGKTALMAAAQRQHIETVKILLEAGASVNEITGFGVTAVDFACSSPFASTYAHAEGILKLLLQYGARVGIPVEDALTTTMCRSHPCIHDSFLLKMVRRATACEDDDEEDSRAKTILGVLLDHSTEANITRVCWQEAVMEAFIHFKSEPANPAVCRQLGAFGRRLGYVFDDATLANTVVKLIVADDPAEIGPLFMLGDGEAIRTVTGVFTKTALLTLIMVRHYRQDFPGEASKLVGPLLDSVKHVKGTIRLLKNKGTLLHLAASGKDPDHVKTLLDRGCDINAMNLHGITPLSEAVLWGDLAAVKILLDRGADPYLSNRQRSSPILPDASQDVLGLPPSERWARAFAELLAKFDCPGSPYHWYLDDPSPFEIAVRKGRNAILEEFIKRRRVLPAIPPDAKKSYMTEVLINGHFSTAHLLLRAGADPNGGEGVDIPPIAHLAYTLRFAASAIRDPDEKRMEILKRLGVISHLVRAGADVNRKSKLTDWSAVMYLDSILHGVYKTIMDRWNFEFPLAKVVGEVLTIRTDESGKQTVRCRNRGIDSWVR
ncbi:Ankyrin repeat-containing domain protein [Rhypophila sp. PSN 637]